MGVFSGYQIALELTSCIPLKKKQELRKLITTNDGVISFMVTKKCKLLVTLNDEEKVKDSFKCQTALKLNIPVVESRYVFDCISTGHLVDPDPYVLLGNTKNQLLTSGVIAAPQGKASGTKNRKRTGLVSLSSVKVWISTDKNAPSFPEDDYEVAKSIQLVKSDKKLFFVAEIHVASSANNQFKYRVFAHSGVLSTQHFDEEQDVDFGKKEYRYSNLADECLMIYSRLCDLQTEAPNLFTRSREYLGRNIGSKKFQQMQLESRVNIQGPEKEVCELVEHIWKEALGELEDVLSVPISSITTEQVEKAESVLLELKRLLVGDDEKIDEIRKLSDEFYDHLSHNVHHQTLISTKRLISKKQELCQLIRDMVSASEGTDWSLRCPLESKYRALRCHIKSLKANSAAFDHAKRHILTSQKGKPAIEVHSIFEVGRSVEEFVFNAKMDNKQLLFHSSHVHNYVGILSRGLLLPKVIVDDCGGSRTDVGLLGSGIYFADDAGTSAKYSNPSKCKGSRLMLVSEVALGKCLDLFQYSTELNAPPEGYDSVHGVKASAGVTSDFKDDEYAIYRTNQQRLRYLVEFRLEDDALKVLDDPQKDESATTEDILPLSVNKKKIADSVELNDVQDIPDPLSKVKAGLVSDSSAEIPLTAVHVKARLIDLAAQVVVYQHYKNRSNDPIEAKYVFPLDEMAAVCGFEAFINDKHIVGEVKEKETAHREYREAISQGHGAYLMDQDVETPDVFTVSVGNLPPQCDVMIKITYVAELQMEGEKVLFRIPACVAPWKKSSGLDAITQSDLETVKVTEEQIETSVQVAVEMPFEIKSIDCTTHLIRLKKTDTKAVVEMQRNQPINEGFQLLISLAEIHVPRMWVERFPDNPDSCACMLTFYPEFEAGISDGFEVIFLLDLSNSMKGNSLLEAKKILVLSLLHLPESCFFNVIIFGTDYDELFPFSRLKTPSNVRLAEKFIKNQEAVMGNTEVIRPLGSLYLLCPEDGLRNLFLVSDGHISNEKVSLEAVRLNCQHSRLFTFGVGSIANHHSLRSLATAGCGYYEFFNSKMKSRWETKIRNQLAKASQPSLSSIRVDWHNFSNVESAVQAPAEIMALFNGCRQVVYGFVPDCTQATLRAVIDNQEVSTMVSTADLNITTGKILHQLTARAVIQDWNDGQLAAERIEHEMIKKNRKNYVIELSKEFSIITQFTSFVAVEKREAGEVMAGTQNLDELVQKDSVDILDYMGWEDVNCRVNIMTFERPPFSLDVNLNETFGQLRSKLSEETSKLRTIFRKLFDVSVADEESLWDHGIENEMTIYAFDEALNFPCGFFHPAELNSYVELMDLAKVKHEYPELDLKWENEDPVEAFEKLLEDLPFKCEEVKNKEKSIHYMQSKKFRSGLFELLDKKGISHKRYAPRVCWRKDASKELCSESSSSDSEFEEVEDAGFTGFEALRERTVVSWSDNAYPALSHPDSSCMHDELLDFDELSESDEDSFDIARVYDEPANKPEEIRRGEEERDLAFLSECRDLQQQQTIDTRLAFLEAEADKLQNSASQFSVEEADDMGVGLFYELESLGAQVQQEMHQQRQQLSSLSVQPTPLFAQPPLLGQQPKTFAEEKGVSVGTLDAQEQSFEEQRLQALDAQVSLLSTQAVQFSSCAQSSFGVQPAPLFAQPPLIGEQTKTYAKGEGVAFGYKSLSAQQPQTFANLDNVSFGFQSLGAQQPQTFANLDNVSFGYQSLGAHQPQTFAKLDDVSFGFQSLGPQVHSFDAQPPLFQQQQALGVQSSPSDSVQFSSGVQSSAFSVHSASLFAQPPLFGQRPQSFAVGGGSSFGSAKAPSFESQQPLLEQKQTLGAPSALFGAVQSSSGEKSLFGVKPATLFAQSPLFGQQPQSAADSVSSSGIFPAFARARFAAGFQPSSLESKSSASEIIASVDELHESDEISRQLPASGPENFLSRSVRSGFTARPQPKKAALPAPGLLYARETADQAISCSALDLGTKVSVMGQLMLDQAETAVDISSVSADAEKAMPETKLESSLVKQRSPRYMPTSPSHTAELSAVPRPLESQGKEQRGKPIASAETPITLESSDDISFTKRKLKKKESVYGFLQKDSEFPVRSPSQATVTDGRTDRSFGREGLTKFKNASEFPITSNLQPPPPPMPPPPPPPPPSLAPLHGQQPPLWSGAGSLYSSGILPRFPGAVAMSSVQSSSLEANLSVPEKMKTVESEVILNYINNAATEEVPERVAASDPEIVSRRSLLMRSPMKMSFLGALGKKLVPPKPVLPCATDASAEAAPRHALGLKAEETIMEIPTDGQAVTNANNLFESVYANKLIPQAEMESFVSPTEAQLIPRKAKPKPRPAALRQRGSFYRNPVVPVESTSCDLLTADELTPQTGMESSPPPIPPRLSKAEPPPSLAPLPVEYDTAPLPSRVRGYVKISKKSVCLPEEVAVEMEAQSITRESKPVLPETGACLYKRALPVAPSDDLPTAYADELTPRTGMESSQPPIPPRLSKAEPPPSLAPLPARHRRELIESGEMHVFQKDATCFSSSRSMRVAASSRGRQASEYKVCSEAPVTNGIQTMSRIISPGFKSGTRGIEAAMSSADEMRAVAPLDFNAMKTNEDGWNVSPWSSENELYFNLNISKGKVTWTLDKWKELHRLFREVIETETGYWDLDDELGDLLCVDVAKFNRVLVENGVNSLGCHATSDVIRLLVTILVLFRIYESVGSGRNPFSLDVDEFKHYLDLIGSGEEYKEIQEEFNFLFPPAARFCLNIDDKHPLLYSRLNLGRSWPEAAANLLGMGKW